MPRPYQAEELVLSFWTEVQMRQSQKHVAQVWHCDGLGSVQDVLGRRREAEDSVRQTRASRQAHEPSHPGPPRPSPPAAAIPQRRGALEAALHGLELLCKRKRLASLLFWEL